MIAACGQDVREDKVLALGHTSAHGTETDGILRTLDYYAIKYHAGCGLQADELLAAIDCGHPVLITLQAYRDSPEIIYASDEADGINGEGRPQRRFIIQDPSSWTDMYLDFDELDQRWHDVDARRGRSHRTLGLCGALAGGVRSGGLRTLGVRHEERQEAD